MADGQISAINATTNETKRISVICPPTWAANEYHNCTLKGEWGKQFGGVPHTPGDNGITLDCLKVPAGYTLDDAGDHTFVMDVKFSGNDKQPNWTCQNVNGSLICKN